MYLAISKRVASILEENGIQVVQTRTDDTFIVELFQNSPLFGVDIDLERQGDIDNREVEL